MPISDMENKGKLDVGRGVDSGRMHSSMMKSLVKLGVAWVVIVLGIVFVVYPSYVDYNDKVKMISLYEGVRSDDIAKMRNEIGNNLLFNNIEISRKTLYNKFADEVDTNRYLSKLLDAKSLNDISTLSASFLSDKRKETSVYRLTEGEQLREIFPIVVSFADIVEIFDSYSVSYTQYYRDAFSLENVQFGSITVNKKKDKNEQYDFIGIVVTAEGTEASILDFLGFVRDTGDLSYDSLRARYPNLPRTRKSNRPTDSVEGLLNRNKSTFIFDVSTVTISIPKVDVFASKSRRNKDLYKVNVNMNVFVRKPSLNDIKILESDYKSILVRVKKIDRGIDKNKTYKIAVAGRKVAQQAKSKKDLREAYIALSNAIFNLKSLLKE